MEGGLWRFELGGVRVVTRGAGTDLEVHLREFSSISSGNTDGFDLVLVERFHDWMFLKLGDSTSKQRIIVDPGHN